nr:EOG090X08PK [Triops cancriformis]
MDPAEIPSEDTSSTSSESEDEKEFVFYRSRKEWQDIQQISLDEGDFPIVAIAYSDKFKDVFGYFRAIVLAQEKSQRALDLTKDAAELNPANYTVWQYRRILLRHLKVDLHKELKYLRHVMEDHPKNYQVWHHRRMIVEWLNEPIGELRFTEIILSQDAKNYHAWQHRQWVLSTFNLFENELNYVDRLLQEDIRNNSAWNQRYFVINHTTGFTSDVIQQEIQFVARALSLVSHNESAWNYLRGILLEVEEGLNHPEVMSICQNLRSVGKVPPFLLAFEVDAIEELLQRAKSQELLAQALEKCQDLAQSKDTIRAPYWTYIAQTLTTKYS